MFRNVTVASMAFLPLVDLLVDRAIPPTPAPTHRASLVAIMAR